MRRKKQIALTFTMFLTVIMVGTFGYYHLLKVTPIDALYMTVITISTVGYKEVGMMTPEAKIFSIFIIFLGVGTAGYIFSRSIAIFIEGSISDLWRSAKMQKRIAKLENHYILCGAGESGRVIVEQFSKKHVPFVIIEKDEELVRQYVERGNVLIIEGDATEEEILEKARIRTAKGLVTALSKDVDNLYTVLTARQLNSELYIISRAIEKSSPSKLIKAGANNTISSNEIGGRRMAALMLRPSVVSFLDIITQVGDVEFGLEDIIVCEGSELVNKKIGELSIPKQFGLIIVAVKKNSQENIMFNPSKDIFIENQDVLLVLGTELQVQALKEYAKDDGHRFPFPVF